MAVLENGTQPCCEDVKILEKVFEKLSKKA